MEFDVELHAFEAFSERKLKRAAAHNARLRRVNCHKTNPYPTKVLLPPPVAPDIEVNRIPGSGIDACRLTEWGA